MVGTSNASPQPLSQPKPSLLSFPDRAATDQLASVGRDGSTSVLPWRRQCSVLMHGFAATRGGIERKSVAPGATRALGAGLAAGFGCTTGFESDGDVSPASRA